MFGDDVHARPAFDHVGVYADAAAQIVPLLDASELARELVNRVDAFFRREAGVRGAAVDDEFGFADAFAGGLEQAARPERRFEHEDGVAAACFGFDEFPRGFAADLFVGRPKEDDSVRKRTWVSAELRARRALARCRLS